MASYDSIPPIPCPAGASGSRKLFLMPLLVNGQARYYRQKLQGFDYDLVLLDDHLAGAIQKDIVVRAPGG